jgi:hypothetical protein
VRLVAPALRLELLPARGADAAGFVRVRVIAGSGGFRGDFETAIQPEDLRRFEREIDALESGATRPARATLYCVEPGIDLRLDCNGPGVVDGHFALESEREGGGWTTLSGTFELDPGELPAIRTSILALLDALEG